MTSYLDNTPLAPSYNSKRASYVPQITFDEENGIFSITGESYHEYSVEFFQPILDKLRAFTEQAIQRPLEVTFKMTYFNTSTARRFFEIFEVLEKYHQRGAKVSVKWYYKSDDLDIFDSGVEFSFQVSFEFECIAY